MPDAPVKHYSVGNSQHVPTVLDGNWPRYNVGIGSYSVSLRSAQGLRARFDVQE